MAPRCAIEPASVSAVVARGQLARILVLLGSDFDAEVVAAARHAERIRRQLAVTWDDLSPPPSAADQARPGGHGPRRSGDVLATWPGGWREAARYCVRHHRVPTAWETEFCYGLTRYRAVPSSKQMAILRGLLARAVMAGAEGVKN
jgi:hypothetical protein